MTIGGHWDIPRAIRTQFDNHHELHIGVFGCTWPRSLCSSRTLVSFLNAKRRCLTHFTVLFEGDHFGLWLCRHLGGICDRAARRDCDSRIQVKQRILLLDHKWSVAPIFLTARMALRLRVCSILALRCRVDDPVDAFAVHAGAGSVGP